MRKNTIPAGPLGMHVISPHLVCSNAADAIEFYKKAFGAEEMFRLPGPDGKLLHASLKMFGSSVMLVDENPDVGMFGPLALNGTAVIIHLIVEDMDAVMEKAVAAGATVVLPAEDMFWGDRYGIVEDPFGHRWSIASHIRDMTPDDIRKAMEDLRA